MTIKRLKELLEIFSKDNDAEVKVSTMDGFLKITEVEFANDINTLVIHVEDI